MSRLGDISDPTGVLEEEEENDTTGIFERRDRIEREDGTEIRNQNNRDNVFEETQDDEENHMFGDHEDKETQIRNNQGENKELNCLHQLGAVGGAPNQTGMGANANDRKDRLKVYTIQKGRLTKLHRKFNRLYWEDLNNIAKEMVEVYNEVMKSFTEYYATITLAEEKEKAQNDFKERSANALHFVQLAETNRRDPTRPGY